MKFSDIGLKPKIYMGLLFPLIFLVLLAVISVTRIQGMLETEERVKHTNEVLRAADLILASATDIETGVRGYLLAGKDEFLEPYRSGQEITYSALAALKVKVSDNPGQVARLVEVEQILRQWQREVTEPEIALRQQVGDGVTLEEISDFVGEARGKAFFDRFRGVMAAVIDEERSLLAERAAAHLEVVEFTEAVIWGGLFIAVLIVVGLGWLIGNGIANPIAQITRAMRQLASGEGKDIEIPGIGRQDEVGDMAEALQVFREAMGEIVEQNWMRTALSTITSAMYKTRTLQAAAREVLKEAMPLLESGHGLFYRFNKEEERLELMESYAHVERKHVGNNFKLGEGLVGQCALEEKPIILTEVPDDYIEINSGLGSAPPKTIAAYPILLQGGLQGVIEIGSFRSFSPIQQKLLEGLMPAVALYLDNLELLGTEELLAETREQAEELRVSGEKLREREEELTSINEELTKNTENLEQRTTELEESEQELKAQGEELKVSNEELVEKTEDLEGQKQEIEAARQESEIAAQELERASQYKSQFLATMSHELRTPLNSLLILAKGLSDNDSGKLGEEDIESAQIIHESGSNLLRLINDILDLSKIEAGETKISLAHTRLADVAAGIDRHFRHVAAKNNVKLNIKLADDLPESIETDPDKLDQILNNLLSNALKFTEKGSVSVSLHRLSSKGKSPVPGRKCEELIAFEVKDTGIGVSEADCEQIFDAFKQVDATTTRKYAGTGLGLSISRKLAELLGGDILVTSVVGKGSIFNLVLPESSPSPASIERPLQVPEREQDESYAPAPNVPDDRDNLAEQDQIIVVIEDDPSFAKIVRAHANSRGFRCLLAGDAKMGLALVAQYNPAGVILDIGLPDLDGWSVMARLKDNPATRHIPVFVISGLDDSRVGFERGAVGYLVKPVTKPQLDQAFTTIERLMPGAERKLLIVGEDKKALKSMTDLLANNTTKINTVKLSKDLIKTIEKGAADCVLVLLASSGPDALGILSKAVDERNLIMPPIVVYSDGEISHDEEIKLREFTGNIIVKGQRSDERLVDEITLHLHSLNETLPAKQKKLLESALDAESALHDRTVLIVDDDMRNVFALSKALRAKGMKTVMAKDGESALKELDQRSDINIVLMDVMMPGMDGNEATRRIRKQSHLQRLPIIAVTAKAMRGDREKCLKAGANDYLAKPIDMERLATMMRMWI